jgi:hypothetical protein
MPYSVVVTNLSEKSTASIIMVEQWLPSGLHQHSCSWFRAPTGHRTMFLFFLHCYVFWNGASSSKIGGGWLLLVTPLFWGSVWQWLPFRLTSFYPPFSRSEQVGLALTFWICIREVLGSVPDRDTGCPNLILSRAGKCKHGSLTRQRPLPSKSFPDHVILAFNVA